MCIVVGDMATWHSAADPVLHMDIASLASSVSSAVIKFSPKSASQQGAGDSSDKVGLPSSSCALSCSDPGEFEMDMSKNGCSGSRVATLIIPHDLSRGSRACCIDAVGAAVEAAMAAMGCSLPTSKNLYEGPHVVHFPRFP